MKKATTLDIADELGLSRTTVSRALNNHPGIPEATRRKVVETAARLGYKHYKETTGDHAPGENDMKTFAFLMKETIERTQEGYWVDVLRGAEDASRQHGCNLVLHFITDPDVERLLLPRSLTHAGIDGVILAGLTDSDYIDAVGRLGLPHVMIDCYSDIRSDSLPSDVVLMESEQGVYELTAHLIRLGHTALGFVGDIGDCRSFYERWIGFRRAMLDASLPVRDEFCAIAPAAFRYFNQQEVSSALRAMKVLPSAFVCANDLVALRVIRALEEAGARVPRDVSVTGFDRMLHDPGLPALRMELTTVAIAASHIGARAVEQLLWRTAHPDRPYEHVRIASAPVYGGSTGPAKRR